jgi:hypothetical protein
VSFVNEQIYAPVESTSIQCSAPKFGADAQHGQAAAVSQQLTTPFVINFAVTDCKLSLCAHSASVISYLIPIYQI